MARVSEPTHIWDTHPQLLCAGNIRTVDYAGPYNLSLLSVQADEIQGDAALSVTTSGPVRIGLSMLHSACSALHRCSLCPEECAQVMMTILQAESSEMLFNAAGIAAKQSYTDKDIIDFLTNVE